MAIERISCTSRFEFRINMEHKPRHLAPIGALRVSIKQPQIGDDVLLIVWVRAEFVGATSATSGSSGGFFMSLCKRELFLFLEDGSPNFSPNQLGPASRVH